MPDRHPITEALARKLIAARYPRLRPLPMAATSRPGAFVFQIPSFGVMTIVDDIILNDEQRLRLASFLRERGPAHRVITAVTSNEARKTVKVVTNPKGRQEYPTITSWRFERQSWCLPHIFAGLRAEGREDHTALKHFDAHFATSAHDRMAARDHLAADLVN